MTLEWFGPAAKGIDWTVGVLKYCYRKLKRAPKLEVLEIASLTRKDRSTGAYQVNVRNLSNHTVRASIRLERIIPEPSMPTPPQYLQWAGAPDPRLEVDIPAKSSHFVNVFFDYLHDLGFFLADDYCLKTNSAHHVPRQNYEIKLSTYTVPGSFIESESVCHSFYILIQQDGSLIFSDAGGPGAGSMVPPATQ
jgi:hypothetical protein